MSGVTYVGLIPFRMVGAGEHWRMADRLLRGRVLAGRIDLDDGEHRVGQYFLHGLAPGQRIRLYIPRAGHKCSRHGTCIRDLVPGHPVVRPGRARRA